jgi:enoyl-CoA hydratase/carnithine racemase
MTSASPVPETRVEVADRIMTITLDRPDKLNAFTFQMMKELIAAFDRADEDDEVRAVIVTGAGRAFCAGADLGKGGASAFDYDKVASDGPTAPPPGPEVGEIDRMTKVNGELRDGGGLVTLRIFRCLKPVIAAINGPAVGVGATMTLPMDIRLASDTAKFGFVFAARGIVPEAASSWFLPRLVGISQALEWCYSARVFPATDALAGGLVRSLHAPDDLLPAARAIATEIATNSAPVSVAMTRMMMWRMLGASHPMEAHKVDSRAINHTGRGRDATEGITAFFEKRPAEWSMQIPEDLPSFVPWWIDPVFE